MAATLTAEDVVRRIAAECAYVDERGASAFASSRRPRSCGATGNNFGGRRGDSASLGRQNPLTCSE
jgi:hypothetical protein